MLFLLFSVFSIFVTQYPRTLEHPANVHAGVHGDDGSIEHNGLQFSVSYL